MTTLRFHDVLMIMFAWIFPDRFLQLHAAMLVLGVGARGKTHTQGRGKTAKVSGEHYENWLVV